MDKRSGFIGFIILSACFLGLFVWIQSCNLPGTHFNGRWLLPDPDDYMRLYRVRMILDGQASIVRHISAVHPPEGIELHWTAPLDYLILAAVKIASLGGDARSWLMPVGAWLPVGLGLVYLATAMGLLYRAIGITVAVIVAALIVLSPGFQGAFRLGHSDHHCLMELCMMLSLYSWLTPQGRVARVGSNPSSSAVIISGICIGLAIWVSVLSMVAWAAILVGAIFATYHASSDHRSSWARLQLQWSIAALAVVTIGWLIENASSPMRFSIDKISVFHVAILACAILIPSAASSNKLLRWTALLIAAAALVLWFHRGYSNLVTAFDRPEFYRWSSLIAELQPLILHGVNGWSIMPLLRYLGLVPFALPLFLWLLRGDSRIHCMAKVSFGLLAAVMTGLSIVQLRWADHYMLAVAPVAALGLTRLSSRLFASQESSIAVNRAAFLSFVTAFLVFPSAAGVLTPPNGKPDPFMTRLMLAIDAINRRQAMEPTGPSTIMCEYDAGPILLYETGLPVVAGPYHRGLEGIVDVARFYSERDDVAAREELRRLGIGYVVVPYTPAHQLRILETIAFGELHSYEKAEWKIQNGELFESITFKPDITRTVSYRLTQCTGTDSLGVKPLEKIDEGANTPDHLSGLVYVVGH